MEGKSIYNKIRSDKNINNYDCCVQQRLVFVDKLHYIIV